VLSRPNSSALVIVGFRKRSRTWRSRCLLGRGHPRDVPFVRRSLGLEFGCYDPDGHVRRHSLDSPTPLHTYSAY